MKKPENIFKVVIGVALLAIVTILLYTFIFNKSNKIIKSSDNGNKPQVIIDTTKKLDTNEIKIKTSNDPNFQKKLHYWLWNVS